MSFVQNWKFDALTWRTIWIGAAGLVVVLPILKYRKSIKKRVKAIEESNNSQLMVRVDDSDRSSSSLRREIRLQELNPEFVDKHKDQWNLVSMGQYLNGLKPCLPGQGDADENSAFPEFIEREIEAMVGAVLLKALGRRFGGFLLPMLGIHDVHSKNAKFAANIASWWVSHYHFEVNKDTNIDHLQDAGCFPINLGELIALVNMNQKFVSSSMEIKSLEWMRRGEIGYDPSFGNPLPKDKSEEVEDEQPELIPNPFIVSMHWDEAIEGMEKLTMSKDVVKERETPNAEEKESTTAYDPESRDFPEPTPINPRLLPDLHLGWGNAKCSHTKREIIRNRLLSVLLNKLSYNYYKKEQGETDLFTIQMTPEATKKICFPQDFVQALLDAGHTVEMCPRATITSFGVSVCVKEKDGSFSNIPVGMFFRSGYERKDGRPAHYIMPHGGTDLQLTGPLVGKDSEGNDRKCNIQFYLAIEGMCGWHSNHNAEVPWLRKIASTNVYNDAEALLGVKLAGILAVTFNAIGTEMDLPYGGYGLVGVCNDTAALLDFGVRGETNMFPLVSTGRFMLQSSRRLIQLYSNIKKVDGTTMVGDDVPRLIAACCHIPSDLQASPSNLISSSKRFLASQPEPLCFQIEQESKDIIKNLMEFFSEFDQNIKRKLSGLGIEFHT